MYYLGDKEMNITNSIFTNSYANFYGAAIFSRQSVTIMYSNFSGNTASAELLRNKLLSTSI